MSLASRLALHTDFEVTATSSGASTAAIVLSSDLLKLTQQQAVCLRPCLKLLHEFYSALSMFQPMMVSHTGMKAKQAHSLDAGQHKAEEVWHVTQVANLLNEEIPQIFTLCGRGPRSTLRLLRPGLAVTEMAVSPLPGNPTAVWTIKRSMLDEFDAYIIVSFTNATLVRHCLSRGPSAVQAASPERGISDIFQCQQSRSMLLAAMCSECKTVPWEA